MSINRYYKLKKLLKEWPSNTVVSTDWLKEKGISASNIQKYYNSGWIERYGSRGGYRKAEEIISWSGVLYGWLYKGNAHIGGLTALELHGSGHFISSKQNNIYLFTTKTNEQIPNWVQNTFERKVKLTKLTILNNNLGIEKYDFGNYSLPVSTRERAIFELIWGINKFISPSYCELVFENLATLRAELMQNLLENCSSVKVKRLILFLAEKHKHSWYNQLNLKKINLGNGIRQITKGGKYNSKYKIVYPSEMGEENELKF